MAKAKSCGLLESIKALPPNRNKNWFDTLAPAVQAEVQVIIEQKAAGKIAASWTQIAKELVRQLNLPAKHTHVAEKLSEMSKG